MSCVFPSKPNVVECELYEKSLKRERLELLILTALHFIFYLSQIMEILARLIQVFWFAGCFIAVFFKQPRALTVYIFIGIFFLMGELCIVIYIIQTVHDPHEEPFFPIFPINWIGMAIMDTVLLFYLYVLFKFRKKLIEVTQRTHQTTDSDPPSSV